MTQRDYRHRHFGVAIAATVVMLAAATQFAGPAHAHNRAGSLPLRAIRDVPLPGSTTRFDYQSVDTKARRLYVAHLGDSTIDVVDLDTLRIVATIPHLADVHGVIAAPDLGRVFATATGSNEVVTIDQATNREIGRTHTGAFPDGVAYDSDHHLVFVSNKDAGSLTVVDANTGHATATIKLADEVGNVTYDPTTRRIYAAVRTPDALVTINPTTRKVTNTIRLSGCDGAYGVYVDPPRQRAFVACENNARLVTVDLTRGSQTASTSVGQDPDVLAFDASLQRLYVASESGVVTVFATSGTTPKKTGQTHLADTAHSVAVDPITHRVYFPLQSVNGRPVLRVMSPKR